jgi:enoyl-CoA hydratase/carnithine racemase
VSRCLGAMTEQPVLMERRDRVMVLTLNRPERMNGWTEDLEEVYFDHLDRAEADDDIRAVVVTGNGRAFCAGADFGDLEQLTEGAPAGVDGSRPRTRPYYFDKPLIAALNGATAGLGLVQALYCDVRFCAEEAKITTAFARRGLIGEYGIAWLLPRLVGAGRARDLLLSARTFDGHEAGAIGLVEHVVSAGRALERAIEYADDLARNCSPTSIAVMKAQFRRAYEDDFGAATAEAEHLLAESLGRPDLKEGIASFLERREPDFGPMRR